MFPDVYVTCGFPSEMHPASVALLANYLEGLIPVWHFLTYFHMPDSRLIDLGFCIMENFPA